MDAVHSGWAVPQLTATSDDSMLEQATTSVAVLTGARSAYMTRVTPDPDVIEVVAAVGPAAPPLGFGPRITARSTNVEFALPLRMDDQVIGHIVALDVPAAVVLSPSAPGQLELLACTAALALHGLVLSRELESSTAAATERKYRVINGIVHYLKDVLGAASEYVQLLDTETPLTSRQQQYVGASRRNIDAAVRLMSELLDLGRAETGRMRMEWQPVDAAAVLRGMVRDYQLANGATNVTFDVRVQPSLPRIRTDIDMLRRILDTLLSNAVRYSGATGRVELNVEVRAGRRAHDPKSWLCVAVSDYGPGVAERDQVFEEVARAEALASSPGFRLPISRRLARLLGGDLTLVTDPGKGSTFTVWLPANGGGLTAAAI